MPAADPVSVMVDVPLVAVVPRLLLICNVLLTAPLLPNVALPAKSSGALTVSVIPMPANVARVAIVLLAASVIVLELRPVSNIIPGTAEKGVGIEEYASD